MAEAQVPFPLLLGVMFNRGRRLPKREGLKVVVPVVASPSLPAIIPTVRPSGRPFVIPKTKIDVVPVINNRWGNLLNDDFRYWVGASDSGNKYSRCRLCGLVCLGEEERNVHRDRSTCRQDMVRVLNILRVKNRCVTCEKQTQGTRWGVPLCSDYACEHQFRVTNPASIGVALYAWKESLRAAVALNAKAK